MYGFTLAVLVILLLVSSCSLVQTDLQQVTTKNWEQFVISHHNSYLVVYVWASWCRPCTETLVDLVKIQKHYESKGLHFVYLSLDDEQDDHAVSQVQNWLREANIKEKRCLLKGEFTKKMEMLDIDLIPSFLVYHQKGTRLAKFSNKGQNDRDFLDDFRGVLEAVVEKIEPIKH